MRKDTDSLDRILFAAAEEENKKIDYDAMRTEILKKAAKRGAGMKSLYRYASAAAVFVLLLGAGILISVSGRAPADNLASVLDQTGAGTESQDTVSICTPTSELFVVSLPLLPAAEEYTDSGKSRILPPPADFEAVSAAFSDMFPASDSRELPVFTEHSADIYPFDTGAIYTADIDGCAYVAWKANDQVIYLIQSGAFSAEEMAEAIIGADFS